MNAGFLLLNYRERCTSDWLIQLVPKSICGYETFLKITGGFPVD